MVTTPLGNVTLAITSGSHAYVEGMLLVRGKEIHATMHITYVNGEWTHLGTNGRTTLYTSVPSTFTSATQAACKVILEKCVPAVITYLQSHPNVLVCAEHGNILNKIDRVDLKLSDLKKDMELLEKERVGLQGELAAVVVKMG